MELNLQIGEKGPIYNIKDESKLRFYGMYFGFSIEEKRHIFFTINAGRVLRYSAPNPPKIEWWGDGGDDEPVFSLIPVRLDYEVGNELERKYIIDTIKRHKN